MNWIFGDEWAKLKDILWYLEIKCQISNSKSIYVKVKNNGAKLNKGKYIENFACLQMVE